MCIFNNFATRFKFLSLPSRLSAPLRGNLFSLSPEQREDLLPSELSCCFTAVSYSKVSGVHLVAELASNTRSLFSTSVLFFFLKKKMMQRLCRQPISDKRQRTQRLIPRSAGSNEIRPRSPPKAAQRERASLVKCGIHRRLLMLVHQLACRYPKD